MTEPTPATPAEPMPEPPAEATPEPATEPPVEPLEAPPEAPARHIEAATLAEAREQARLQLQPGFDILTETVEEPGRRTRLRSTAKTTEDALEKARAAVPAHGTVVGEDVVTEPERFSVELVAKSQVLARRDVRRVLRDDEVLERVEIKVPPRRLLGVVREPGKYEATVLQAAVVELTYETPFQVAFTTGPKALYESERVWGAFGPQEGNFYWPVAITTDAEGHVFVSDNGFQLDENHQFAGRLSRVQQFDAEGNWLVTIGSHGTGAGQIQSAQGIAVASDGHLYVADGRGACIHRFRRGGEVVASWGAKGSGEGELSGGVLRIALSPERLLYVCDHSAHRVLAFDLEGVLVTSWGTRGSGESEFERPQGICVDSQGNVYVADAGNNRVQKFDGQGNWLLAWGTRGEAEGQFKVPRGIAVDGSDYVYVCGADTRVQKFDSEGQFVGAWGTEGKKPGELDRPEDLAVDHRGRVYVLEYNNTRVQVFA